MTAKKKKKGRCWPGCKPVAGKKPFSKGSCSCGMAALTPGMIELMIPVIPIFRNDIIIRHMAGAARQKVAAAGQKLVWGARAGAGPGAVLGAGLGGIAGGVSAAVDRDPNTSVLKGTLGGALTGGLIGATAGAVGGAAGGNTDLIRTIKARSARFQRKKSLCALTPGMIEFAADNRPRNGNGQYIGNETMGVDPNSMQAAYGNVEQEKMMRRRSLVQRMRAMMGRGGNDQVAP